MVSLNVFSTERLMKARPENKIKQNTVEPRLAATSLIRPPRYYGHLANAATSLMRPPR